MKWKIRLSAAVMMCLILTAGISSRVSAQGYAWLEGNAFYSKSTNDTIVNGNLSQAVIDGASSLFVTSQSTVQNVYAIDVYPSKIRVDGNVGTLFFSEDTMANFLNSLQSNQSDSLCAQTLNGHKYFNDNFFLSDSRLAFGGSSNDLIMIAFMNLRGTGNVERIEILSNDTIKAIRAETFSNDAIKNVSSDETEVTGTPTITTTPSKHDQPIRQ